MRRRRFIRELAGVLTTLALGALLGGLFRWSGGNRLAAAFSAVNGSTWEYMKVLFFSVFLYTLAQVWALGRRFPNLLAVRAVSVLAGLAALPALYYTCTGAAGRSAPWVYDAAFLLADLGLFWLDGRLLRAGRFPRPWQQVLGLLALWALAFCFVWYTFRPQGLPPGLRG